MLGRHKPLLGVCVGMQLLASCSMEGSDANVPEGTPGLGFIPGRVEHLRSWAAACAYRILVGTRSLLRAAKCELFDGIPDGTDFYFVHSYAFVPEDQADILATTDYGDPSDRGRKARSCLGHAVSPRKEFARRIQAAAQLHRWARMLKVRVIPTLLWKQFGLVKGVRLRQLAARRPRSAGNQGL